MKELPKMPKEIRGDAIADNLRVTALRAYLARAMEYAEHKPSCLWLDAQDDDCSCGLDAFRAFLREQGVSDE